jgi:hypothetical protein
MMGIQQSLDTLGERDRLVGHQRVYSVGQLRSDVESSGFAVSSTRGFFFKPLPNSMMLSFSPELIRAMNDIASTMPVEWLANVGMVATPRRSSAG